MFHLLRNLLNFQQGHFTRKLMKCQQVLFYIFYNFLRLDVWQRFYEEYNCFIKPITKRQYKNRDTSKNYIWVHTNITAKSGATINALANVFMYSAITLEKDADLNVYGWFYFESEFAGKKVMPQILGNGTVHFEYKVIIVRDVVKQFQKRLFRLWNRITRRTPRNQQNLE